MKPFLYGAFSFLLLISCSNENRVVFSDTVHLAASENSIDGVYLKYPYRVRVDDTLLFITDLHGDSVFCHEYDYPALKYRKSFARKGKAPGHFLSVGNIATGNGKLYLLDVFARKIYRREDGRDEPVMTFPVELGLVLDFAVYNDSVFIVPDNTGINRICLVDRNGTIIRNIGKIPVSQNTRASGALLAKAWRGFLHYNPNNNIVAFAAQFGDVLEIYEMQNGQSYVSVGSGGEPKFRFEGANASPDGVMGYGDVFVGDRYIYAVYWGHRLDDIKQGKVITEGGNLFRVFDLKGNPVKQYQIDNYVTGFFIDEETGKVIATDPNNELLITFRID